MIYAALGLGFALGVACCLALGVYCALRLIRDYDDRTEADDDTSPTEGQVSRNELRPDIYPLEAA